MGRSGLCSDNSGLLGTVFLFSEKPLIVIIVFLWGPIINLQIVKCLKLVREGYFEHHLTFFLPGVRPGSLMEGILKFVEIKKRHEFIFKGNP